MFFSQDERPPSDPVRLKNRLSCSPPVVTLPSLATGLFLAFAFMWLRLKLEHEYRYYFPTKGNKWQRKPVVGWLFIWVMCISWGFFKPLASPWGPVPGSETQRPNCSVTARLDGANLLLKVSLFLHIFNQFFSGVTEWSEGEGVIHKGVGVVPRTFTAGPWAPHPQVLLASLEVLYSLSHVGALCYCFSWFIKCVWIIMEMLWFLFPIKILTWLVLGFFFWIYFVSCCFPGISWLRVFYTEVL